MSGSRFIVVAAAVSALAACADGPRAQAGTGTRGAGTSGAAVPSGAGDVVARVGDHAITLADVDEKALQADAMEFRGMRLGQALFEARRQAIDALVAEHLLEREATSQGLSKEALVEREVTTKLAPVTDADLETWYKANSSRLNGQPLEAVRTPLRAALEGQRQQEALAAYLTKLRGDLPVELLLEPPRQTVEIAANDPTLGPPDAPVRIVEFSDFQ